MNHPKIAGLPDGAFRLWVEGLAYCQTFLTDGAIPVTAFKGLRAYSAKRKADLVAARLWDEAVNGGVLVHDYLDWNESRAHVQDARRFARIRIALVRDPVLRKALQERDGNTCRYCGVTVNWHDRKGPRGATYDHVVPGGADDESNLVVACRGCNSRKGPRTPEQAGMVLRPPVTKPRSEPESDLDKSSTNTTPLPTTPLHALRPLNGKEKKPGDTDGRSNQIVFRCQRFVVFRWMYESLAAMLGPHLDAFALDEWFYTLADQADRDGLVVPQRDGGKWLLAQTEAEARRRGLPIAAAPQANSKTAGNAAAVARFIARGGGQ